MWGRKKTPDPSAMVAAKTTRCRDFGLALAGLAALLFAAPAGAQSNDEIQTATQFNFSTPGARSLGLGGAFLGLADDATAAYANPAGLTQLLEPEVSLEGRGWSYSSRFVERGHVEGEPSGVGIDTVPGLQEGRIEDDTGGVSFASYVHVGERWAFSVYRHELARFEASLLSEGIFLWSSNFRISPVRSHLRSESVGFGIAGAWEVNDALALGLGLASYDFDLSSLTERFAVQAATGDPLLDGLPGGAYGPADFSPRNVFNTQVQEGEDDDLAVNLGVLWRPSKRWSLGAVYRDGPEFDFTGTFICGPANPHPGQIDTSVGGEGVFHIPDVWGIGAAFRISDSMLLTLDWDRIDYRDISDHLLNMIRVGRTDPENYVVANGDEIHLGFEYLALNPRFPTAVRLGIWHDPDHQIHYIGDRALARARFQPGEDETHVSAGLGLVVGRAQFDLAVDLSDRVDTLSFSTVARF